VLVGVTGMCLLVSLYVIVSANSPCLSYYVCFLVLLCVFVSVNRCVFSVTIYVC